MFFGTWMSGKQIPTVCIKVSNLPRLSRRSSWTICLPEKFVGEKDRAFAQVTNQRTEFPVMLPAKTKAAVSLRLKKINHLKVGILMVGPARNLFHGEGKGVSKSEALNIGFTVLFFALSRELFIHGKAMVPYVQLSTNCRIGC